MLSNKWWIFTKKTKELVYSTELKNKLKYLKGSIIAVVFGILISMVIITALGSNPLSYFASLFKISLNGLYIDQTFQWISIYVIVGLAIAISFKSGNFNIGISGQMMIGSGLSIIFMKEGLINQGIAINSGHTIIIFLITIISGAILAGIAGLLKAMFNIHEVVSTIMLNWTIWYLFKYIFQTYETKLGGDGVSVSASIPAGLITIGSNAVLIPILLALFSIMIVGFLLRKTVFGFKIQAVGISENGAKYSGYNVKTKMIQAMLISGSLAGLASFINITTINPNIGYGIDNLPLIGYDAIAISLVAYNNPVGILFTSILWGIIQSSGTSTASLYDIPVQLSALIFGIIVYFAAISVIFINYSPLLRWKMILALFKSKKSKNEMKELIKEQFSLRRAILNVGNQDEVLEYKKELQLKKENFLNEYEKSRKDKINKNILSNSLNDLKKQQQLFIKEYRQNLINKLEKVNLEIIGLKKTAFLKKNNLAKSGIQLRHHEQLRNIENQALNKINNLNNANLIVNDEYKKLYLNHKDVFKNAKKEVRKTAKLEQKTNYYWYEAEFGILTSYYEMKNSKIENLGEIQKQKINLTNDINSLKAEFKLKKVQQNLKYDRSRLKNEKNKLKRKTQELKQNFVKLRTDKLNKINKAKRIYELKLQEAKNNHSLEDLKNSYQVKKEQTKQKYLKQLAMIKSDEKNSADYYDFARSQVELSKCKILINRFKSKLEETDVNLYNLKMSIKELKEVQSQIKKIYESEFSDYDSPWYLHQKYLLYKNLTNLNTSLEIDLVIYQTKAMINQLKSEHHELVLAYDQQAKQMIETYKQQVQSIKQNKELLSNQKNEQLVVHQEGYLNQMEQLALNLETKYLTLNKEVN